MIPSPLFTAAQDIDDVVEGKTHPVLTTIAPAVLNMILLTTHDVPHVPVVIRSAFMSHVALFAVVVHCIRTYQLSQLTTGSVNPVTSVSVELLVITKSEASFTLKSQYPAASSVCHVAVVALVAFNICPVVGAVAALVSTTPVALFNEFADPVVF